MPAVDMSSSSSDSYAVPSDDSKNDGAADDWSNHPSANAEARSETSAFVSWRENGVIVQRVKQYAQVGESEARKGVAAIVELCEGEPKPLLVDLREPASISSEARAFFASEAVAKTSVRVALLQGSTVTALAGNLFVRINRPAVDTRIFTSEEKARLWLQQG